MRLPRFGFVLAFVILAGCTAVLRESLREAVESCAGEDDGTPCASAEVCLGGQCVYSSCGDSFVDEARGEDCDDGNLISGDGCEPGRCRWSCSRDEQCNDDDPCTDNAGCETATHSCRPSIAASGAACERDDGSNGLCRSGLCADLDCGDGVVQPEEECDSSSPGCRGDCQWVCDAEAPCSTADRCAMPVHCDDATHECVAKASPECEDDDACSADTCDSFEGCVSTIIDSDGDGYSPYECSLDSTFEGGDCDDANPNRHPGAPEMENDLDDDCNGMIDDNVGVTCLRDADGDGYGDPSQSMFVDSCTGGWVASRPRNDCHDSNAAVHPGITTPSSVPYCISGSLVGSEANGYECSDGSVPSWDWNCDGEHTPEVRSTLNSCADLYTCGGTYWATAVPGCGTRGTLRNCTLSCLLVVCSCGNSDTPNVLQRCL